MDSLPNLVLDEILKCLNFKEILSARSVCWNWNSIILSTSPAFRYSLHYVHLESEEHFNKFLATFAESAIPVPFQRLLWNPRVGTEAQLLRLAELVHPTIKDLCITDHPPRDLEIPRLPSILLELTSRIRFFLHLLSSALEVLRIEFCFQKLTAQDLTDEPVLRFPKLYILDTECKRESGWCHPRCKYPFRMTAPVLQYKNLKPLFLYDEELGFLCPCNENCGPSPTTHDMKCREQFIKVNSRRYVRNLYVSVRSEMTETGKRLLQDQVRNVTQLDHVLIQRFPLDYIFPRAEFLSTGFWAWDESQREWFKEHLQRFSPLKFPKLKRVHIEGDLSFNPFVYPTVTQLSIQIHTFCDSPCAVAPLHKMFPNVTSLKLGSDPGLWLPCLLPNLPLVRRLFIDCCGMEDTEENFDLVTGGMPDVVSFAMLESLEFDFIYYGTHKLVSVVARSSRRKGLTNIKSIHMDCRMYIGSTVQECEEFVDSQMLDYEILRQKYKTEWWMTRVEESLTKWKIP